MAGTAALLPAESRQAGPSAAQLRQVEVADVRVRREEQAPRHAAAFRALERNPTGPSYSFHYGRPHRRDTKSYFPDNFREEVALILLDQGKGITRST